jgi:hypothetical protein
VVTTHSNLAKIRMEVPTTPPPKAQPTTPPQLKHGNHGQGDSTYEAQMGRAMRILSLEDNLSPQSVFEAQVVHFVESRMLPVRRALFLANA